MEEDNSRCVVEILLDDQQCPKTDVEFCNSTPSYSLEQLKTWSYQSLKNFCSKFGLISNKRTKEELIALAFSAQIMNLKILPTAAQSILTSQQQYKQLSTMKDETILPDPLREIEEISWIEEEKGVSRWPKISVDDIENYFVNHGERLNEYKKRKGYEYYSSNWLSQVFMFVHFRYVILKSTCTPSPKINCPPHELWILFEQSTSTILRSYCTCTAG